MEEKNITRETRVEEKSESELKKRHVWEHVWTSRSVLIGQRGCLDFGLSEENLITLNFISQYVSPTRAY